METKIRTLGVLNARSFSVDLDEVQRQGDSITRRLVIRHPSAVAVVPLIGADEVLVVAQFRYAMGRELIEFPAGKLDPGEEPATAASRELAEETGYRAGRLDRLLSFAPSVGYSNEIIHVYLARDLTPSGNGPDEAEISKVETMKLARVKQMILSGEIIDGVTILALAAYEWSGARV
ncbi:MAG: NUDIX hydrolase [Thermodesulfobacteriota bacterium]